MISPCGFIDWRYRKARRLFYYTWRHRLSISSILYENTVLSSQGCRSFTRLHQKFKKKKKKRHYDIISNTKTLYYFFGWFLLKNINKLWFWLFSWVEQPVFLKLSIYRIDHTSSLPIQKMSRERKLTDRKNWHLELPGGPVVENMPANANDMGSIPGLERSHVPLSNWGAIEPVCHNYWARVPSSPMLCNKRSQRTEKPTHHRERNLLVATKSQCSQKFIHLFI